jgi:hypothetical protein
MNNKRVFFGTRKADNSRIYLTLPTWDCGWYWSFGYLGNNKEHYHLSGYQKKDHFLKLEDGSFKLLTEARNLHMHDVLMVDYDLNPKLSDSNLWKFCELARTAYSLKETAEVFGRGGSHITTNPCAELIKNPELVKKINEELLPTVFMEIEKLFE